MLADTSGWGWWGCSAAAGQCAQPSVLQPRPAPPPPSLHCSVSPRPPARQHTAKNIFVLQKYFMWWSKSVFSLQKSFHGCILLSYGKELLQSSLGWFIHQRAKSKIWNVPANTVTPSSLLCPVLLKTEKMLKWSDSGTRRAALYLTEGYAFISICKIMALKN